VYSLTKQNIRSILGLVTVLYLGGNPMAEVSPNLQILRNEPAPENMVSKVVGNLAIALLDASLQNGETIKVPSLDITISGSKSVTQAQASREGL
jgi:hypothetical protein